MQILTQGIILGKTPIHTAILAENYFPYDLVEFLLTRKAKGQTPLKLALAKGDEVMIQLLKRYCAI